MRRHGFVVEHLQCTLAEVAHPVWIVFDVADVVDGAFRQTVTGVVLVAFGKKEVAFAAIDVAGGERGAHVWMGGLVGLRCHQRFFFQPVVPLGFQFQGEVWAAGFDNPAVHQHMNDVGLNVIEQALVMSDDQKSATG